MLFVKIGEESVQVEQPNEEKLTNAIVKLTRQGAKKVYFVTGHNERPAEGKGADGKDTFWEWEHIAAKAEAFDPIFAQAKTLIDKAEQSLPNLAMPGLR